MIASARQLLAIFTALYPDFTASFKHEAAYRYRRNIWPYCALLGSEHRRRTKEKKTDAECYSPDGPRHSGDETVRHAKDAYRAKEGIARAFEKLAFAL